MKIFCSKDLVEYLSSHCIFENDFDEYEEARLISLVSEILPGTYHAFGDVLVYCYSNGEFEVIDENLFRNIKDL